MATSGETSLTQEELAKRKEDERKSREADQKLCKALEDYARITTMNMVAFDTAEDGDYPDGYTEESIEEEISSLASFYSSLLDDIFADKYEFGRYLVPKKPPHERPRLLRKRLGQK